VKEMSRISVSCC